MIMYLIIYAKNVWFIMFWFSFEINNNWLYSECIINIENNKHISCCVFTQSVAHQRKHARTHARIQSLFMEINRVEQYQLIKLYILEVILSLINEFIAI